MLGKEFLGSVDNTFFLILSQQRSGPIFTMNIRSLGQFFSNQRPFTAAVFNNTSAERSRLL